MKFNLWASLGKNQGFTTSLVTKFINCNEHLQLAPFFNERCNEKVMSIATNMTLHNKQCHVKFDEIKTL